MEIRRANVSDADAIGYIHSTAWKQAYADVFAEEYLNADTPEKRKQEFLESSGCKDISYYIVYEDEKAIGIAKVIGESDEYEIASFYILEQYCNKGYGKQVIAHLKKELDKKRMHLWVLEDNKKARRFYEKSGFINTGNIRMICRENPYVQLQYELLP